MTYATVESGVLDVLRKLADYGTSNSSQGDYRILSRGNEKNVVLLRESATRVPITMGRSYRRQTDWTVIIEVWRQFPGESVDLKANLDADVSEIADHLDQWRNLDGTSGVLDSEVIEMRTPETWTEGRASWWKQDIVLRVKEIDSVVTAE